MQTGGVRETKGRDMAELHSLVVKKERCIIKNGFSLSRVATIKMFGLQNHEKKFIYLDYARNYDEISS